MGYQANVVKLIIASPGDVADERRIATEEIQRWNDAHAETRRLILQAIKWETHSTPRLGQAPQAELNEQIAKNADILIGIFGTRIGTPTESHVSGTVEEIKNHVADGKVAKVYFSDAPVPPSSIDPEQYRALQAFKEECKSGGLYATYADLDSFRREFKQHLDIELNGPRFLWLGIPQAAADQAEASTPVQVSAKTIGPPQQQGIAIHASRPVTLKQIDYLHSTGACIVSQRAEVAGQDLEIVFDHTKLVVLNNSNRPDKNPKDHSGPAQIRFIFDVEGKQQQMALPVHLDHQMVNNTYYVTLTGQEETALS